MSAPLLLDLSHTCHTQARTGIQRVARSLRSALGSRATAITHDPHARSWRELAGWEHANLADGRASSRRGARWPLSARARGLAHRLLGATPAPLPGNAGLLIPEVFSPAAARALPELFAQVSGPRAALFHDAIALQFPEFTPPTTVARFPAYLTELLAFDGIAAVSADSRDTLLSYWKWLGITRHPPVHAIPLGVDAPPSASPASLGDSTPVILSVGTIEGRKNHLALLDACERLWADGKKFSLHLVGLAQPRTGAAALARLRGLQAAGRPLRYDGPASDTALDQAYAACTFTVYPSLVEGFGLPVIESLAHGKPCICSARGALGESATGGGCLPLPALDSQTIAAAIARLLDSPAEVVSLATQARDRRFRTWNDYANELVGWMHSLPLRNVTPPSP